MGITQQEAEDRAKFFYKKIFGMAFIYPITLLTNEEIEDYIRERETSEQIFTGYEGDIYGMFEHAEFGTGDPTEAGIYVNTERCDDVNKFNATLIHELTHCALWWTGMESGDGDMDFERELKKLGLPSNYDIRWDKHGKDVVMHKIEADPSVMEKYEQMYSEYKSSTTTAVTKEKKPVQKRDYIKEMHINPRNCNYHLDRLCDQRDKLYDDIQNKSDDIDNIMALENRYYEILDIIDALDEYEKTHFCLESGDPGYGPI